MIQLIKIGKCPFRRSKGEFSFGLKLLALLIIAFIIIFSRRPDQFLHPYIWAEDGAILLTDFLNKGLLSIFIPVAGYLIISSKIIFALSTLTSFFYYPEISYALTVAFTLSVIAAIALSPTHLRWPWACAILVLLIPTDPEVFGVGLYAFWWAGLLLILGLIWNIEGNKSKLRIAYIIFGGLSSPIVIGLAPLFWARVILFRKLFLHKKIEIFIAALVSIIASIQIALLFSTKQFIKGEPFNVVEFIALYIEKFFGYFLAHSTGSQILNIVASIIVLIIIFYECILAIKRKDYSFILLASALFLLSLMSATRVRPRIIDPTLAGQRYFFYPYVILMWLLVWILREERKIKKFVTVGLIGIAIGNSVPAWSRFHDTLNWRNNLTACLKNRPPNRLTSIENIVLGPILAYKPPDLSVALLPKSLSEKLSQWPYAGPIYGPWQTTAGDIDKAYIEITLAPDQREIALPIMRGPNTSRLWVELDDADTGRIIDQASIAGSKPPPNTWKLLLLHKPQNFEKASHFLLKVREIGDGSDHWVSIAAPRSVERIASIDIPVHVDGSIDNLWHVALTQDQCKKLVQGSLIKGSF
jgi:hypothetical protein